MPARALVAASLLTVLVAGCESKPEPVDPAPREAPRETAAPSVPIELPPSIVSSRQYRCADNSLAFVDFLSDGRSALVRTESKGTQVRVSAPAAGGTMTGGGFSLKGSKDDAAVQFGSPGTPRLQRCRA